MMELSIWRLAFAALMLVIAIMFGGWLGWMMETAHQPVPLIGLAIVVVALVASVAVTCIAMGQP